MERSCIWNFKPVEKNKQLPKSWEEFCEMFPNYTGEYFIEPNSDKNIEQVLAISKGEKRTNKNAELLPDRATADAVLALCQLIQLRNAFNGDWVPDWNKDEAKWIILFSKYTIETSSCTFVTASELYFKTEELRDKFLRCFRPLIEKLKQLYGIKEGGEE